MEKFIYNNGIVKKNLMEQISEALNIVLKTGFGRVRVVIDKERGIYNVVASPKFRMKKS